MAQTTETSPALLRATDDEAPGACEPRLNSLPGEDDMMLWAMLSSFMNTMFSPFFTVISVSENARPFWEIVRSAAKAATEPPAKASRTAAVISFIVQSLCSGFAASARQYRNGGRIDVAVECLQQ